MRGTKSRRGAWRPNVTGAKVIKLTTDNAVGMLAGYERVTARGKPKYFIQDLCDICNEVLYIHKKKLSMRTRGYKMVCARKTCRKHWKDEKVVRGWNHRAQYGRAKERAVKEGRAPKLITQHKNQR